MKRPAAYVGRSVALLWTLGVACTGPQSARRAEPAVVNSRPVSSEPAPPPEEDIARARAEQRIAAFAWEDLGPAALAKARAAGKLVLLDCVATWCHWCHVMDDTTYTDPELGAFIRDHVVATRVDVDARPDISARYEDFGWPATVIFSPQGEELGKFRGYMTAERRREILRAAQADQQAGPRAAEHPEHRDPAGLTESAAPVALLGWVGTRLVRDLDDYYDEKEGGWGRPQKLPLGANIEVELLRAAHGDPAAAARARQSLDQQRALLDPVWGGLYQYSVGGVWTRPHFEKRLPVQTDALQAYARAIAGGGVGAAQDRRDAQRVVAYLNEFLRNRDGLYLVSQDADLGGHEKSARFVDGHVYYGLDDAHRRALGVPRIDEHVYAYENGLAIAALSSLATALGPKDEGAALLQAATRAAEHLTRTHLDPDGGVRREAVATSTLRFVVDSAALGRGLALLASATQPPGPQRTAERIAAAMWQHFYDAKSGLLWASTLDPSASGVFARREQPFAANVLAARFLAALAKSSTVSPAQRAVYRARAQGLLSALARPAALAAQGRMLGEYLLALDEVGALPWARRDQGSG
jgi:uncharacterized protein YyaL (SSP411 family)